MRNVLVLGLLLLVCILGIGFYRGWFSMSKSGPSNLNNEVNVNLTVDPDKMKADAEAVKDKAAEITGQANQ